MSPDDPHFEAIGMWVADEYFSATSRISMSSKMLLEISEGFARRCPNDAIARGFRTMAELIARQRMEGEGQSKLNYGDLFGLVDLTPDID